MSTTKPPDRIYLQWPGDKIWGATWSINHTDVHDLEYLLATPERLAAGEMRAMLEKTLKWLSDYTENTPHIVFGGDIELGIEIQAALAKPAPGDSAD